VLKQLAKLAHPVPAFSPSAVAIAIYANDEGEHVIARESGYEGVACVDDAARALELYCHLWEQTGLDWVRDWCVGLVDFLLAMQDDNGLWVNFIEDWDGTRNRQGVTSVGVASFWHARAMLALATASRLLPDERITRAYERGLPHLVLHDAASDVRSLHVLSLLVVRLERPDIDVRRQIEMWCDEIIGCRRGNMLLNWSQEVDQPHLWGHFQEAALARASTFLHRSDLLAVAQMSARAVFTPAIDAHFNNSRVLPIDVATTVAVMEELHAVSGLEEFRIRAHQARQWFHGRNTSRRPTYDRQRGSCADGIDAGVINANSGAESNIVAAQALVGTMADIALTHPHAEFVMPSLAEVRSF